MDKNKESDMLEARRRFLVKCGKFAVITPPAMTVLLASTAQNYAVASSGGGSTHLPGSAGGNNGFGNGGGDGLRHVRHLAGDPAPARPARQPLITAAKQVVDQPAVETGAAICRSWR